MGGVEWDIHEMLQRMQSGQLTSPELMQVLRCAVTMGVVSSCPDHSDNMAPPQPGRASEPLVNASWCTPIVARCVAYCKELRSIPRPQCTSLICNNCKPADGALPQEVASSPMLIDAVQALLQNSAAYSSLVDHPEMAPYIRGLRRLVGAPRPPAPLAARCLLPLSRHAMGQHAPAACSAAPE